uniref:Putative secreted peptide n=1 Tax=Rhipicephalus pulchellus TaxID=72859 RepID=L7M9T4_RHIPC
MASLVQTVVIVLAIIATARRCLSTQENTAERTTTEGNTFKELFEAGTIIWRQNTTDTFRSECGGFLLDGVGLDGVNLSSSLFYNEKLQYGSMYFWKFGKNNSLISERPCKWYIQNICP